MIEEQIISDDALQHIDQQLANRLHWLAYNTVPFILDRSDMFFFKSREEAVEFADHNINDYNLLRIIHAWSKEEILLQAVYGEVLYNQPEFINSQKHVTMNENNLDYLEKQVKYSGFGDDLTELLREKIKQQPMEFQLNHVAKFGKDEVASVLFISRSKENDMYFFNRMELSLKKEGSDDYKKQTFYVNFKGDNITLKEGYNLMEGRSVYKDEMVIKMKDAPEKTFKGWIQLNPNDADKYGSLKTHYFNEKYNYNIEKLLEKDIFKDRIKELQNDAGMKDIADKLKKGNRQYVTLVDGETKAETKVWIEANPAKRTLNIYDTKMEPVVLQSKKEATGKEQTESKEQSQGQAKKDTKKQDETERSEKANKRQGARARMS